MRHFRGLAAGGIALLAMPWLIVAMPAQADAIRDAVRRLGLLGSWADNCAAPPSQSNWYITFYATSTGTVRRKGERGPNDPTLDGAIDRVERLTPTTLRMTFRNDDPNWGDSNGRTFDVVVEVTGNTSRSLSSIGSDGVQYISEGRFKNGNPVPVLKRCR